jgi:hypothetical protein
MSVVERKVKEEMQLNRSIDECSIRRVFEKK